MVTFSRWPEDARRRLADIRGKVAVGLHLNLTLGHPLGSMPGLAPEGVLPPVSMLVKRAVLGRIDPQEIEAEARRQLDPGVRCHVVGGPRREARQFGCGEGRAASGVPARRRRLRNRLTGRRGQIRRRRRRGEESNPFPHSSQSQREMAVNQGHSRSVALHQLPARMPW